MGKYERIKEKLKVLFMLKCFNSVTYLKDVPSPALDRMLVYRSVPIVLSGFSFFGKVSLPTSGTGLK